MFIGGDYEGHPSHIGRNVSLKGGKNENAELLPLNVFPFTFGSKR